MMENSSVLVVCHPGHELRLYGWMKETQPHVFVFTDGSGSRAESRCASTRRLLDATGSLPGSIFGDWSDAELYQRLLKQDHSFFLELVDRLAEELMALRATTVVADAAEGYNSGHDVCRLVVDAAVRVASRWQPIRSYAVALVGPPHEGPGVKLELNEAIWREKMQAASNYPELAREVENAVKTFGEKSFAHETLIPCETPFALPEGVPYYEEYGAKQVAAGFYQHVIRQCDHLAPLARKLAHHVARRDRCAA